MSKTIQIKISRSEIDGIIRNYINKKIVDICKKQRIDDQILFEVEQAAVEVKVPDYEERLAAIEFALARMNKNEEKQKKVKEIER